MSLVGVEHRGGDSQRIERPYPTDAEQDLTRSIERRKQQALERIAQTEAQAIAQVRNTAVDVALNAAEALLRDNIAAGQAQTMVDKSIAELSKSLN